MQQTENGSQRPFSAIRIFLTGFAMGAADLIPGVSGGTMAFILGVYEQLLNAIKSFNVKLIQLLFKGRWQEALDAVPIRFLIPLCLGLAVAIFSMARLMRYLLEYQTVYLFSFFFGLILASIIAVGATVRWNLQSAITLLVGTVVAYLIIGLVPMDMPNDPLTIFLSSMVAITAMILPGISGSFILLILGQYAYVLNAVAEFNLIAIMPVIFGAIVGLLGFARILSWLLKHYHDATVALLVGFMAGSLRKIWPWKEVTEWMTNRHGEEVPMRESNILPNFAGVEFWFALTIAVMAFVLLSVMDQLQTKKNPILSRFLR
ncbi:DUF368 domain-containing protein [Candidatus Viridilinea mediisalina]|uniref:DUF368 domain-containing protein n=1 Tax=Candidatus Viridilinea mediisalina TaxID=2024553 RepID=A0A2A6RJT1_9CHLR|nr:DUF368 domain-containing protein [Candidatus Viridilinea mediisalina]PDW03327.1 DUF368 domain-containing protein [Candidatus Viridilinea mediisalina]